MKSYPPDSFGLNAQLEHANIRLNSGVDDLLGLFIVTPNMHKKHHSRLQLETDSNYSNIFPFWDRLCGTYTPRVNFKKLLYKLGRLISETFQEHGYDMAAFNLNNDRVNQVTGRLIEELPGAIRAVSSEREQRSTREYQLGDITRHDLLLPNRAVEHSTAHHAHASNDRDSQSRRQVMATHLQHPDDEFVEQKVNRTIRQLHEQAIAGTSTTTKFESHQPHHKAAHESNADHREQHAHRHVLTR